MPRSRIIVYMILLYRRSCRPPLIDRGFMTSSSGEIPKHRQPFPYIAFSITLEAVTGWLRIFVAFSVTGSRMHCTLFAAS